MGGGGPLWSPPPPPQRSQPKRPWERVDRHLLQNREHTGRALQVSLAAVNRLGL